MTACHDMMSLPTGAALIPDGGSFVNLLKSRINLFFAVPVAMENKGACSHAGQDVLKNGLTSTL